MRTKTKTHKATAKRFKKTSSGLIKHYSQGDNSHLKANKDRGQKARKKGSHILSNRGDIKKITKLM
jgi:large subunit ribosomal protein L35